MMMLTAILVIWKHNTVNQLFILVCAAVRMCHSSTERKFIENTDLNDVQRKSVFKKKPRRDGYCENYIKSTDKCFWNIVLRSFLICTF